MEIYLVGGAVRDELLGRTIKEKDYVVVGATPQMMLQAGYRQVGKDFPVFLHPETHEEYALARKERKVARGYSGFEFDTSPTVTLEEDLLRRDLTINAIAKTTRGELVDPYHGRDDLTRKLLRHVSIAFIEDPVRILRVARFAARFAEAGFTVAAETLQLMREMVHSGEVNALVPERVWKELERALGENNPEQFFQVLADCHALTILFPALSLTGKGITALQQAARQQADNIVRFAVLLHDLSSTAIKELCEHYRVPVEYRELALLTQQYLTDCQQLPQATPAAIVKFFRFTDAYRREQRFALFLQACEIITGNTQITPRIKQLLAAAKDIDAKQIAAEYQGKAIAELIDLAREQRIAKALSDKS